MNNLIRLHETLYQCGCTECYSGITSATPVAWVEDDTYAVILRQDGGYCVTYMSGEELSSFENCTEDQREQEKNLEKLFLIDKIANAHPERFAGILQGMPELMHKILPLLESARRTFEEYESIDNAPIHSFGEQAN